MSLSFMVLLFFILALSVLILVHEWGHFIAARKTGVRVEEFGLGLPPRIWGKKFGETIYSLNWLPIGGFCRLYGEDLGTEDHSKVKDKKRSFEYKKPWQKMIIVLGGVIMNLVLAVVVFGVVYTIVGIPKEVDRVRIVGVVENSPAEMVELEVDEVILEVNGVEIKKVNELISEVDKYKGESVQLLIADKQNNTETVKVEVRKDPPEGEGSIGIAISNTEMEPVAWYRIDKGIVVGFKEAFYWRKIILSGVTSMLTGLFSGNMPKDVSGPIGMYQATSSINEDQGFLAVIHFFGIVSVNLAVVNVLPFPALDGGRLIFVFYEMFTRKRVNQKIETTVN
jgi:regulator of sigma E protease